MTFVELPAGFCPPATEGGVNYTVSVSVNCHWDDVCRVHDASGTACLHNCTPLLHSTEWDVSYYIDISKKYHWVDVCRVHDL